jgi:SAM-dependent methyltransferase
MDFKAIYESTERTLKNDTLSAIQKVRISNPKFLDLGCGDCEFTERIANLINPSLVVAVDSSSTRINIAASKGYTILNTDLNKRLSLRDNSFDIIHMGNVIEHLNNTDIIIKEIRRILSPIGFVFISTNNLASWHNILALMLGLQPKPSMVSDEMLISDNDADINMPKHRRLFTFNGLSSLLEYHGLTVIDEWGSGYYPFSGIVQEALSAIDYKHSAYLLVRACK